MIIFLVFDGMYSGRFSVGAFSKGRLALEEALKHSSSAKKTKDKCIDVEVHGVDGLNIPEPYFFLKESELRVWCDRNESL